MPMPSPNLAITVNQNFPHNICRGWQQRRSCIQNQRNLYAVLQYFWDAGQCTKQEGTPMVGVLRQHKLIKVVVMNVWLERVTTQKIVSCLQSFINLNFLQHSHIYKSPQYPQHPTAAAISVFSSCAMCNWSLYFYLAILHYFGLPMMFNVFYVKRWTITRKRLCHNLCTYFKCMKRRQCLRHTS